MSSSAPAPAPAVDVVPVADTQQELVVIERTIRFSDGSSARVNSDGMKTYVCIDSEQFPVSVTYTPRWSHFEVVRQESWMQDGRIKTMSNFLTWDIKDFYVKRAEKAWAKMG